MDSNKSANGTADSNVPARLNRDSSSSNSQQSQPTTTQTSRSTPLPSREPSPKRPTLRSGAPKAASTGSRSRKNSLPDTSPVRSATTRPTNPPPSTVANKIAVNTTPTLQPVSAESTTQSPVIQKSPTAAEQLKDSHRWPVSPRLRSPPPILNRPNLGPPGRKPDQDLPLINVQRSTPPPAPPQPDVTESDTEESHLLPGMRTPARGASGGSTTTLETVQEVSPLPSPQSDEAQEKLEDSLYSEAGSQADHTEFLANKAVQSRVNHANNESGSDSGSAKGDRRPNHSISVPPPLATRQSSVSTKHNANKAKPSEGSVQNMTVETETVTSIPQVSLAPAASKEANGTLRAKPSAETIRPRKEKKKTTRKQPTVGPGTGEPNHHSSIHVPRLRHHQSMRSVSSTTDALISPTRPCAQSTYNDEATSPRRSSPPTSRNQNLSLNHMGSLLTRSRTASSKADIFEAKIASAVDEADTSDSEETFVYDSNPPADDRPRRFHSRTPSATSMVSNVDRAGMRSLNTIMDNGGPSAAMKKSMKFVNTFNSSGNDSAMIDEEGKGTARSAAGSARVSGTARVHHHHFGRWGRNGSGNGHTSLFDNEAPFHINSATAQRSKFPTSNTRQSSQPPSPRFSNSGRISAAGNRGMQMAQYDMDDTTGADDERTPLIHSSLRSARQSRARRHQGSLRALENQNYRSTPTVLNRFASCLVLTVMLLLVVSGAIGFMFATSQPLGEIQLKGISNVLASESELMFDLTVRAHNPNVVVVIIDSADLEIFAKSPYAGTDPEWWSRPDDAGTFAARRSGGVDKGTGDEPVDPPTDETAPNMRLGTIRKFDSALTFEGSFFNQGISTSRGEVRLQKPGGNGTDHGIDRWNRILQDEFDLIVKGVLKYSLPLSQRVRSVTISGRTTVKPNSANDPKLHEPTVPSNDTATPVFSISQQQQQH